MSLRWTELRGVLTLTGGKGGRAAESLTSCPLTPLPGRDSQEPSVSLDN